MKKVSPTAGAVRNSCLVYEQQGQNQAGDDLSGSEKLFTLRGSLAAWTGEKKSLNDVVDQHLAQIVTNLCGFDTELLPSGYIQPQEDTILQGVIEGIGVYFSSGDNSDESLVEGYRTTDWPASSPFVTAVGGTSLAVGASNNYLFETGWGTTKLIVADEPTTALDVTVQAQVIELLMRLKDELGFALILVSRDLALVADVAAR